MGKPKVKSPCQPATLGGGFVGIPKRVIDSPAYQALSVHARATLIEINNRLDGYNNGKIGIDQREIVRRLRCSPRKVVEAIAQLMEHGLIDVNQEAVWTQRLAREYRLTYISMPRSPATNDYLHWTPSEKIAGSDAVAGHKQSASAPVARRSKAASAPVARPFGKPQKCVADPDLSASDAVAHIIKPYPSREASERGGDQTAETPPENPLKHGGPSVADCNGYEPVRPETLAMLAKLNGGQTR